MDSSRLGAIVVSTVVLIGFILFSYLAMKPETAGVKYEIVLVLLGNWAGLAFAVTGYWVGSTISSKTKDDTIQDMAKKS